MQGKLHVQEANRYRRIFVKQSCFCCSPIKHFGPMHRVVLRFSPFSLLNSFKTVYASDNETNLLTDPEPHDGRCQQSGSTELAVESEEEG